MAATYLTGGIGSYVQGGIDAKTVTNTAIVTTQPGRNWITTGVVVRCTAANAITVGATVSIGTNAGGGYTDIVGATALTTLAAGDCMRLTLASPYIQVPASTAVHINVSVAATGTSQTIEANLIGYYAET